MQLTALHHVTCVCSDAVRTAEFYRGLGFRLVKKTVNFDDPKSYHLYFGDEAAAPGSLITFFEWPRAEPGRAGRGVVCKVALVAPTASEVQQLEDPDGLTIELHPGERAGLDHVVLDGNPDLYAGLVAADAPVRFTEPDEEPAVVGAGITHHVAFRAADVQELEQWQRRLNDLGLGPTEVRERKYFQSVYFTMPDGLLIEIATDGPGFAVDEPAESLGEALSLPDWLEERRGELETDLQPLR